MLHVITRHPAVRAEEKNPDDLIFCHARQESLEFVLAQFNLVCRHEVFQGYQGTYHHVVVKMPIVCLVDVALVRQDISGPFDRIEESLFRQKVGI
jgi:hypothetical protein